MKALTRHIPQTWRSAAWRAAYACRDHLLQVVSGVKTTEKLIALTFDDGPTALYTPLVLDTLAQHKVRATFFMIGEQVLAHPNLTRQVAEAGHAIGNHTFRHPALVGLGVGAVADEMRRCQRALRDHANVNTRFMRPPFGLRDTTAHWVLRGLGYQIINWSVSGDDWRADATAESIANTVLSAAQPGSIVLLHDGCGAVPGQIAANDSGTDRTPTVQALPHIILSLRKIGYRFVTLPQLWQAGPKVRQAWF
jgi:peptidoglycan/xylan/chitin deacetylase (PgdA/CDA1 family)